MSSEVACVPPNRCRNKRQRPRRVYKALLGFGSKKVCHVIDAENVQPQFALWFGLGSDKVTDNRADTLKAAQALFKFETMLLMSSSWTPAVFEDQLMELAALSQQICESAHSDSWRALPQSMQVMAAHVVTMQKQDRLDASAMKVLRSARDACYEFDFELRIEDHAVREQARFYNALAGFEAPAR